MLFVAPRLHGPSINALFLLRVYINRQAGGHRLVELLDRSGATFSKIRRYCTSNLTAFVWTGHLLSLFSNVIRENAPKHSDFVRKWNA